MGKQYAPDLIPDLGVQLPPGRYLFSIAEVNDADETNTGKYMIAVQLNVVEPKSLANNPHWENFVIGNDADPTADDPETWKGYAARRYKDLLRKAGVELTGDVEQDAQAAVGQTVGGLVVQEIEPQVLKNGQPNPYGGRVRSRIAAFFRPGEMEIGLDQQPVAETAAKPTSNQPRLVRAPAPAPASKPPTNKPSPIRKSASLTCPVCNESVPRDQYGQHAAQCTGDDEE